jgi:hypothetical protein
MVAEATAIGFQLVRTSRDPNVNSHQLMCAQSGFRESIRGAS